jgi:TRAP-type C4-dicarboxylate transport system permease small subunit
MRTIALVYERFLQAMALLSGLTLVWIMVAVVISVVQRNLGMQSWGWLFLSTEYGMFYMTLLGAPWLVRQRGHVHIEMLTAILPSRVLPWFSRGISLLTALICAVLAYKGVELLLLNLERGDFDVRAYFFPSWILSLAFPISFGLLTVEFSRMVFGQELLHSGVAGAHE